MLEKRLGRPVGQAFMDKRRSAGVVSGELLVGDVEGTKAIVIDDLIASGATMARAARALREHGATSVTCAAAHGLFTGNAEQALAVPALDTVMITDSVPSFRLSIGFVRMHCETISVAPLFAGCIRCLDGDGSISRLLGDEG
jgi:ribose-phosphate pyrophosphokinase